MAVKLFKRDNFFYGLHQEFFVDGEEDLVQIEIDFDCELGDKAYAPDGSIWVRHSDNFDGELWEVFKKGNSKDSDVEEPIVDVGEVDYMTLKS